MKKYILLIFLAICPLYFYAMSGRDIDQLYIRFLDTQIKNIRVELDKSRGTITAENLGKREEKIRRLEGEIEEAYRRHPDLKNE